MVGVATTAGAALSTVRAQPGRAAAIDTPRNTAVVDVPVAGALRGCAPTIEGAAPVVVATPTTKPTILVVSILLAQLGGHYFAPHKARTERALNDRETFASTPPVTP